MLTLDQVRRDKDIMRRLDWELTPQQAYEAYQIKSISAWRYRSLPEVYFFMIDVWKGTAQVQLVKRTLKDSEVVARPEPPAEVMAAALAPYGGKATPSGQYPPGPELSAWLKAQMGL